jgi:putative NADH-flavin reductase
MRIAVIGASGWLGGLAAAEARERGHEVTEVGRANADATDPDATKRVLGGHDAVVSAYRAPPDNLDEMYDVARSVMAAGVARIAWIGGTGVLRVPGGGPDIVDLPQFPADWRPGTLVHRDVRNMFRDDGAELEWTYISPPRSIEDGERTGSYRTGVEEMVFDNEGQSAISAQDFAAAIVDVLENGTHVREHVTFAY